jgi:hypothetical protein
VNRRKTNLFAWIFPCRLLCAANFFEKLPHGTLVVYLFSDSKASQRISGSHPRKTQTLEIAKALFQDLADEVGAVEAGKVFFGKLAVRASHTSPKAPRPIRRISLKPN